LEEAKIRVITHRQRHAKNPFEAILSQTRIYQDINCFPKEISPKRLGSAAKTSFQKFKNDYKVSSLINLVEWRCCKTYLGESYNTPIFPRHFKIIIDETNVYIPSAFHSMQQNSELLSAHLKRLLHLQNEISDDDAPNDREDDSLDSIYDEDRLVLDHKILQLVAQLEIPIFLSIDASLDKGEAVRSISIVVPDTREKTQD
jgi:hypothetical protein